MKGEDEPDPEPEPEQKKREEPAEAAKQSDKPSTPTREEVEKASKPRLKRYIREHNLAITNDDWDDVDELRGAVIEELGL